MDTIRMIIRFVFLLLVGSVYGQPNPLGLGLVDTLPSLEVREVLNTDDGRLEIAHLKGKAIILDFGNTYCAPCISSLLKMDSMGKMYPDDVVFIMVSSEPKEQWGKLMKVHQRIGEVSIPIVTADTLLYTLFPHITEPHMIWIDKKHNIRAFTGHGYLQRKYIDSLLKGDPLPWPVKWDFPIQDSLPIVTWNPVNFYKPMEPAEKEITYVSGHMPGVVWRQKRLVDESSDEIRLSAFNIPLLKMYCSLLGKSYGYNILPNQVTLAEGLDEAQFFYEPSRGISKAVWDAKYTYCYEMTFRNIGGKNDINKRAIARLNDYFGLDVRLDRQIRSCLVLKKIEDVARLKRAGERAKETESLYSFVTRINSIYKGGIVLDELRISDRERARLRLPLLPTGIDAFALKTALQYIGIESDIEERVVDTVTITQE